jgi:hypothetical protein
MNIYTVLCAKRNKLLGKPLRGLPFQQIKNHPDEPPRHGKNQEPHSGKPESLQKNNS